MKNTFVRPDPQMSLSIVQDLRNDVAGQSVARGVTGELAVLEPQQPAAKRSHPDRPVVVRKQRPERPGFQAVAGLIARELSVLMVKQVSLTGADPERARRIFRQA